MKCIMKMIKDKKLRQLHQEDWMAYLFEVQRRHAIKVKDDRLGLIK